MVQPKVPAEMFFPDINFPMKNLWEIEKLEDYIATPEGNENFVRHLKTVGGHDAKDMVIRILKQNFSNALADICSWTGRKGNYEVGKLKQFDIMFATVHQSFNYTKKEFEMVVMDWLRHAKQRLLRENKYNNYV
ncbi:uncharacterized protein LOC126739156 [Anthonomus grandis grandis]|uniref:uncharacterized protein LOC126739156 n=1 Tax=Anthonomus grandis grandis TaxID=2921223 RepID=UPI002165A8DE|nr:uncharacterized protein LOC126739156 [Anthonomus grandis grandis]